MIGDNPSSGDDQQETTPSTTLDPRWVVGFVDGEGCFSVSIHRNHFAVRTGGWQLHPVFHVYQHIRYRAMLRKEHLDPNGFERLVRLAYSMNEHGKQRARSLDEIIVGSSETARQAPLGVVPER